MKTDNPTVAANKTANTIAKTSNMFFFLAGYPFLWLAIKGRITRKGSAPLPFQELINDQLLIIGSKNQA
jgi:hypothetical protein